MTGSDIIEIVGIIVVLVLNGLCYAYMDRGRPRFTKSDILFEDVDAQVMPVGAILPLGLLPHVRVVLTATTLHLFRPLISKHSSLAPSVWIPLAAIERIDRDARFFTEGFRVRYTDNRQQTKEVFFAPPRPDIFLRALSAAPGLPKHVLIPLTGVWQ